MNAQEIKEFIRVTCSIRFAAYGIVPRKMRKPYIPLGGMAIAMRGVNARVDFYYDESGSFRFSTCGNMRTCLQYIANVANDEALMKKIGIIK